VENILLWLYEHCSKAKMHWKFVLNLKLFNGSRTLRPNDFANKIFYDFGGKSIIFMYGIKIKFNNYHLKEKFTKNVMQKCWVVTLR
jgi:hypothetical protein